MYDCEICALSQNEWFKKRICFNPEYGEQQYNFVLPTLDFDNKKFNGSETKSMDQEDFLLWLDDMNVNFNPDMPAFEMIQAYLNPRNKAASGEICMTGFVDFEIGTLIDLENACNNYHVLPYGGGLLDQPQLLLEAFNLVRSEINRYEKVRYDKMAKAADKSSSSNKN